MAERVERALVTDPSRAGWRLDQLLAEAWPDFSRSRIAAWVRSGAIRVDGVAVKPRQAISGGEHVTLNATIEDHPDNPAPQAIELDVLFEDEALLIVNKPPGLVVHPGSGNPDGTLVNALLHFDARQGVLPRAGLVHRLDKDTSGCLVVARTLASHTALVQAMKRRDIKRHYKALVWGELVAGGQVDAPLGRHPVDRRRQVVRPDGKPAVTDYRIARRLVASTLLDVSLQTGRTHQIRVHMAHAGHPIVGDPAYGRHGSPGGLSEAQREAWRAFPRQALHAARLVVPHPEDGREIVAEAVLPDDFSALVEQLEPCA